nr:ATP synthase F0 subunit 8 [Polysiphonia sp.]
MPQLDLLIILPQLFWMIFLFSIFYFLLTYFFLPLFLKAIISRKKFIEFNHLRASQQHQITLNKQKFVLKKLTISFEKIHSVLFHHFFLIKLPVNFSFIKTSFIKINKKIFLTFYNSISFCNLISLQSLKFFPTFLNYFDKK